MPVQTSKSLKSCQETWAVALKYEMKVWKQGIFSHPIPHPPKPQYSSRRELGNIDEAMIGLLGMLPYGLFPFFILYFEVTAQASCPVI